MRLNRAISLALASVVLAFMTGCDGFFVDPGAVDHINLSTKGFLLKPSDTNVQINATAVKVDNSTADITSTATWTSDTPSVADVGAAGVITPHTAGTATITATSGSISAKATVIVTPASISSFALSPTTVTLRLSQQQQLTPTVTLTDNSKPDIRALLTWSSADTTIANVDSNGLVTAAANFTPTGLTTPSTTITASFSTASETKSATSTINLSLF